VDSGSASWRQIVLDRHWERDNQGVGRMDHGTWTVDEKWDERMGSTWAWAMKDEHTKKGGGHTKRE
jgi:hypothetical protein